MKALILLSLFLGMSALADVSGPPSASHGRTDVLVLTKDNTLSINDVFYEQTASNIIKKAKELDSRVESKEPLYLVISSPGGSIEAGLELIESLKSLNRPVDTITIFAASMGFQTVQGLGERLILKNGTLMSHRARGMFYGEFPGQLDTRFEHYKKRVNRMDELAVSRTKGKHTLQSYHALIENEYWGDGQDAIDQGFADKIVSANCDKSLTGTTRIVLEELAMFGHALQFVGTYDLCPLNTGALKYEILVDGQPFFPDVNPANSASAAGPAGLASQDSMFMNFLSHSMSSSPMSSMSTEQVFAIQQKMEELVKKHSSKEVVKGY